MEVEKASFFARSYEAFLRAAIAPCDRFYRIAGFLVRVRFAQENLVLLLGTSLSHLEEKPSSDAALTISVFDTVSSGVAMPGPPWGQDDYAVRGELVSPVSKRYQAVFSRGSGLLSLLDQEENQAICWAKDLSQTPFWERGAPFLSILHLWLKKQRVQVIHAAAIGAENGEGILLAGSGGSGKSTTALSCLLAGMCYVGDDYCALACDPPYRVHSLYNSGKLNRQSKTLLSLGEFLSEDEKELFFLKDLYPHLMRSSLLVRAIVLPKVTQCKTGSLVRTSCAQGLRALAPSTIFQLPYSGAEVFTSLASILHDFPCFQLNLSRDIQQNVSLIQELLDRS